MIGLLCPVTHCIPTSKLQALCHDWSTVGSVSSRQQSLLSHCQVITSITSPRDPTHRSTSTLAVEGGGI